ncbi:MgtC/SapB family protein [Limnospira sp. Paracas R14]|uniref:MgtC/SapB family protein n=1 Tax=Limnospira sp. Paracas R14 TaxID=2981108 RepID=UPI0028E17555|nr:MgtC/SapB family protein [Limnospira sp. Paracas R14]
MNPVEFLLRLATAVSLGSLLGVERQWRQRMAGLRTNTLVATGATLFVMFSVLTPDEGSPTRVAAQVVSGIGFLAGGVILREGLTVKGLNTAATLWCSAAIGALSGGGFLVHALMGTTAVLFANTVLRPLSYRINQQPLQGTEISWLYHCNLICDTPEETRLRSSLLESLGVSHLELRTLRSEKLESTPSRTEVQAELATQIRDDALVEQIISRLSTDPATQSVYWRVTN